MSAEKTRILSVGMAHKLAQNAGRRGNYGEMQEICDAVVNDPDIIGDANDYHNLAVVMSREADDYLAAYQVAEKGLVQFPYNTDLLADAIYYGSNAKKYDNCKVHATTLNGLPRSTWTWRAFSFLIDYYKNRSDWENDTERIVKGLKAALAIAEEYQRYLPSEERSYLAEYEIRQRLAKVAIDNGDAVEKETQRERALSLLKDTINNGEYSAVQCSLAYADAMFERQEYQEVIDICNKALQFGEATASVRLGYLMYLSAQSREILLYKSEDVQNEEKVRQIYAEYVAALVDAGDSYRSTIERRIRILAAKSGVPAPEALVKRASSGIDPSILERLVAE